ncbi:MAG: hypoxanthine phosphoribosyltransferase [Planctomycetota bacterium]|nr:hypoxanthine phosphoribosyltransferase [Planctomycetota bacterium]MDI6786744.1 hypoxanthine phosphoribosyltransferase [Planctomycetota bacterium]
MKIPVLLSKSVIKIRVKKLARQISRDYRNKKPVFIGILNGSFIFMADLIRNLSILVEINFIRLSSYKGKQSSGKILGFSCGREKDFKRILQGKDVIIVDDIIDTGLTTDFLARKLKKASPKSLKVCALLSKPEKRIIPLKIDYLGFSVPNKFVVGYGLDYKGNYRQLNYIGYIRK